ncbi:MFS general substrate transporter [Meira miltonrushii]|uniref:MFS general substrate transporter n=1 Tax=Meira miltonrushii TaxID=1280837 RepID=A0A316V4Z5_9BASI|nr:MFS general substrate transporter [Meira miltonrushii]PWN32616.1 MFS general substrate transporter [Meira miltonrushii]
MTTENQLEKGQHQQGTESPISTPSLHDNTPDQDDISEPKSEKHAKDDGILVEFSKDSHDPSNPATFSNLKKWWIIAVISTTSTMVTCASSVVSTGYQGIEMDLHVSHEVAILGLSLFVLGLGSGPIFLAPFSEFYGRRPVYLLSLTAFFLLGFPVAFANNPAVFFIFRYLTGFAGSAFLSVAGGSITDMYSPKYSFFPMAVYTSSPFMGPVLGPVYSGFVVQFADWRWSFRVIIIWSFVQLILVAFTPETFPPQLLIQKARRIRKETGNNSYYAQHERDLAAKSLVKTIAVSGSRVFLLLALEPMLLLLCLWCAILLGILYLFFELFPIVFAKHNFNDYQNGLSFLGLGIGVMSGVVLMKFWFAKRYTRLSEKNGGKAPPEARLDPAKLGAILCPIGLFIFAFTSYRNVHWIAPIIGSIPFGVGFLLIFTSVFTFTTDNWRPVAASGMGANSVARSIFAAAFPLFATQMASRLTTTGAAALLAGLNVVIIPLPFVFARYGPQLRAKSKYAMK